MHKLSSGGHLPSNKRKKMIIYIVLYLKKKILLALLYINKFMNYYLNY